MKVGVSGNTQQTYKGLQLLVSLGYDIAFIFGLPDEQLESKVNSIKINPEIYSAYEMFRFKNFNEQFLFLAI